MDAQIRTDSLGNITIHMKGNLDFENNISLKSELVSLISENPLSTITIDMHHLEFVGSSGIGAFVQTVKSFNTNKELIKLSNVKSEFLAVFKLYEFDNDETEELSQKFAGRKLTFQN